MATDHRDLRGRAFRNHRGRAVEDVLTARPPPLLEPPRHLVFRGNRAQRDIWVSLGSVAV